MINRSHFSCESPIDWSNLRSKNFLSFLLPLGIPFIIIVEPLASHLHELHDHNMRQMTISNYNYQFIAESYKRLQKLTIRDEVLIRMHPTGNFEKNFILDAGVHSRF